MEKTPTFDRELRLCMAVGLECAVIWLLAFFCNVGAFAYPLLALLQLGLVVAAIVHPAGRLVAYGREVDALTGSRLTLLMLLGFVLCAVVTTFGQAVYFRYFDGGFFASQFLSAMDTLVPADMGIPKEAMMESLDILTNPATAARALLSTNLQFALMGTIPASLIAAVRNRRRK